jgi:TolB protein
MGGDDTPAWSRDGRYLAFVSTRDGNAELYLARADGSRPTRLTHADGDDFDPVWTP